MSQREREAEKRDKVSGDLWHRADGLSAEASGELVRTGLELDMDLRRAQLCVDAAK